MRSTSTLRSGLDPRTADRLLAGLPADDAPPEFAGVARVLALVAAPAQLDELAGEDDARRAYRRGSLRIDTDATRSRRHRMSSRLKLTVAGLAGGLTLTTGLAGAGALPGAAQDVAAAALATVGIHVPGPDDHSGGHADERGKSLDAGGAGGAGVEDTTDGDAENPGQGSVISGIATTTDAEGVDKGAEISGVASDGQSQAGVNGEAGEDHGQSGEEHGQPADSGKSADAGPPTSEATGAPDSQP